MSSLNERDFDYGFTLGIEGKPLLPAYRFVAYSPEAYLVGYETARALTEC